MIIIVKNTVCDKLNVKEEEKKKKEAEEQARLDELKKEVLVGSRSCYVAHVRLHVQVPQYSRSIVRPTLLI